MQLTISEMAQMLFKPTRECTACKIKNLSGYSSVCPKCKSPTMLNFPEKTLLENIAMLTGGKFLLEGKIAKACEKVPDLSNYLLFAIQPRLTQKISEILTQIRTDSVTLMNISGQMNKRVLNAIEQGLKIMARIPENKVLNPFQVLLGSYGTEWNRIFQKRPSKIKRFLSKSDNQSPNTTALVSKAEAVRNAEKAWNDIVDYFYKEFRDYEDHLNYLDGLTASVIRMLLEYEAIQVELVNVFGFCPEFVYQYSENAKSAAKEETTINEE